MDMEHLRLVDPDAPALPAVPYFSNEAGSFTLYHEDSFTLLPKMGEESVDFIFADPPYFLSNGGATCRSGKRVSVNKGKWDKSKGVEENHAYNLKWLSLCQSALKKNGTLMVSGTHHTIFSIGYALQQLGFKLLNDITWFKPNAPPNLSCRYFTHTTETVLWAAKDKNSKHTFNYKEMKEENGGKQMRSMWKFTPPKKAEKANGKHPTQKPISLLDRIVRAATNPGDLILDPYNGSGTTGIASLMNGRRYVGVERETEYLDLTVARYNELVPDEAAATTDVETALTGA